MKRHIRRIALVGIVVMGIFVWGLAADSQALHDQLLRLHVVGASDSKADQDVKLLVRDAVLRSLEQGLEDLTDPQEAYDYVQRMLPKVEAAANRCLEAAGFSDTVAVSLTEEAFPTRAYDTFSLPAGIYEALRITIGSGEGRNWWCVAFPPLCLGAAEAEAAAYFTPEETALLKGQGGYVLKFRSMELLGQLKGLLF